MRRREELKADRECTFRPKINNASKTPTRVKKTAGTLTPRPNNT